MTEWAALVVAGGTGDRYGGFKQFELLDEKPLIQHSLEKIISLPNITQCVVVLAQDLIGSDLWISIEKKLNFPGLVVVAGGKSRSESVNAGLKALDSTVKIVAVHDAARPFFPVEAFDEALNTLMSVSIYSGVIIASPCTDTIKRVTLPGRDEVAATIPRDEFVRAETPQVCRASDLRRAYEIARGKRITDESMVLEMAGMKTGVVVHNEFNIKVTTKQDLLLADAYSKQLKTNAISDS